MGAIPAPSDYHPDPSLNPLIRLDLFPANVASPDESVFFTQENGRVIVTTDAIFVFTDSPRGPALALQARLDSVSGTRDEGYTATFTPPPDDDGNPRATATLRITPSGGCGCGSRLRGFVPWEPMRYAATS